MGSSGPKEVLKVVRKEMGKSSGGLQQGDAPGAQGPQRKALESLDKFRQALQKMGEGSSGGGGGIPLPFMSPGNGRGNGRGGRGPSSNDKVEIPQPEQYRAPAEFRQEILDAAKEGTVEAYKDAVQRYYEEIIK